MPKQRQSRRNPRFGLPSRNAGVSSLRPGSMSGKRKGARSSPCGLDCGVNGLSPSQDCGNTGRLPKGNLVNAVRLSRRSRMISWPRSTIACRSYSPPTSYDQWLDPTFQHVESLKAFLRPYPSEELMAYPVSTLVNNPRHDTPQCLERSQSREYTTRPSLL